MKKILGMFTLYLLIVSCSNKSIIESAGKKKSAPFGTKEVAANIYVDKARMGNIDYKEYLYWVSRVYGKDSQAYKKALPDTTVWRSAPEKYKKYEQEYFGNPKYDDYSLVGITEIQASNFAGWRTDRVAEAMLIELGAVLMQPDQRPSNHFTIERYLSGTYQWTVQQFNELIVPVYTLPTKAELKLYNAKVKTKYLIKESKVQLIDSNRPAYAKSFWCVAKYKKFKAKKGIEN